MTTLLESKARPYGSGKGAALSVALHGALIAALVVVSGNAVLPEREKIEEHAVLFVTPPPPPKVHVAPEPLPEPKKPPPTKAPRVAPPPPAPRRVAAPPPRASQQPQVATPVRPLIAPINVPVSLPPVDLKGIPTVTDVPIPPAAPARASATAARSSSGGDVERGGSKGGLGSGSSGRAYSESQVDRAVVITRSVQPRYPEALRSVSVQGEVRVRYIVDTRGRVEPGSIQVISTPHRLFTDAVREALLSMRFRPAEAGGQPVRQLVEQPFVFRLQQ